MTKKHKIKLDDKMESNEEIMGRMFTFLRETAIAYEGKNILVVSHGDIILTLLDHIGYFHDKKIINFENTGYVVLKSDGILFTVTETEGLETTADNYFE